MRRILRHCWTNYNGFYDIHLHVFFVFPDQMLVHRHFIGIGWTVWIIFMVYCMDSTQNMSHWLGKIRRSIWISVRTGGGLLGGQAVAPWCSMSCLLSLQEFRDWMSYKYYEVYAAWAVTEWFLIFTQKFGSRPRGPWVSRIRISDRVRLACRYLHFRSDRLLSQKG